MFPRKNRSYIPVCSAAELPDTFSLKEVALKLNMKIAFQQKILKMLLCGAQFDTFVDDNGVLKPSVYRVQKSITGQTFRIHKDGLKSFLNQHQSELESMGVDKRRLYALIYDMEAVSKPTSELLSVWDLSFRFTKNSKIISKVSAYIAENFAPLSYVDSNGQVQSVFVFSKGKTGRSALYFKKDALDFFCSRYGDMITKAVEEIDRDNPYLDLRSLSRKLNGTGLYEVELKKFIFRNCLNDTFERVDEENNVVSEKIFDLSDGRTLNIRKEAVPTFVERYQTALEAIGCKGLERFLVENDYQEISSDQITLKDLALQWGHASFEEPLVRLAQKKGKDFVKVVDTKTESKLQPVLKPYYLRGHTSFVIDKADIPTFIANFKDELLEMGIQAPVLEQFYLGKSVSQRTEDMFEIRQMLDYLCVSRENKEKREKRRIVSRETLRKIE